MKVWYHLIAAVVGLAIAALIVYAVFGNASKQGATQDGAAPGSLSSAGAGLCGSIAPGATSSPATRKVAGENPPALFDAKGPIPAISDTQPEYKAWVARVHAAAGLCTDEIRVEATGTTISLSTVDGVGEAAAAAYAAGALAQAFTPPANPLQVTMSATIGGRERTAVVSQRAWRAFGVRVRQLGLQPTMHNLVLFQRAVRPSGLRLTGWK